MLSADRRQTFLPHAGLALILLAGLASVRHPLLPPALVHYPQQAVVPLAAWIGDFLNWLAREAAIGPVKISEITRGVARIIDVPMNGLNVLLTTGWRSGFGEHVVTVVPPLGWVTVLGLCGLLGWRFGGWRLGLLNALGLLYIAAFGLWADAMMTVSSVLVSTAVSVVIGLAIGAASLRHAAAERGVAIVMNVMQTVPVFSYLVPTLLFLGYGPSAALAATVIYALPPMVHATVLGLKSVPAEALELGNMTGASRRQIFWKIKIPSAMPALAIGINQAVMACLNMVIVASMIGSGGLGYVVLTMLRKLDIGHALEAGLAIVVLVVILDRLCQAVAQRVSATGAVRAAGWRPGWRTALGFFTLSIVAAWVVPVLQVWPEGAYLTTAPFWNGLVSWMNVNLFDVLDGIRSFTLLNILNPTRNFLLELPWFLVVALLTASGMLLGGIRCAALAGGLTLFVVLTGYWDAAMVSVYLVGIGSLLSLVIGIPVGFWLAQHTSWRAGAELFLDTLQTLPTLVYILPAVMLFRNGDFSAILAITSYAVAPAVRYSMHAFSSVPESRLELARMSGASALQTLRWIRLPAAFPTLLLGVNQTVMMAIAMLVITALVGTRDLGQQVFIALSRMRVGEGIVAGLAVAAIALTADALIRAAARNAAANIGVRI
jgi:glycine betaine/proline transport system permease protein